MRGGRPESLDRPRGRGESRGKGRGRGRARGAGPAPGAITGMSLLFWCGIRREAGGGGGGCCVTGTLGAADWPVPRTRFSNSSAAWLPGSGTVGTGDVEAVFADMVELVVAGEEAFCSLSSRNGLFENGEDGLGKPPRAAPVDVGERPEGGLGDIALRNGLLEASGTLSEGEPCRSAAEEKRLAGGRETGGHDGLKTQDRQASRGATSSTTSRRSVSNVPGAAIELSDMMDVRRE